MTKYRRIIFFSALLLVICFAFGSCVHSEVPYETSSSASEAPTQIPEGTDESTSQTAAETVADTDTESSSEAETEPTVERVPDDRGLTPQQYSVLNITGTDDFGRVITPVSGKDNPDRYVGMFFFLTLGQHTNHSGIYDINAITYEGLSHKAFTDYDTFITPVGAAHFWGEPVFGYYNSLDPWVIRKQVEMLTMAGIDFIVLDTSNNVLYEHVTSVLFRILLEYQEQGWDVPKVVYYLGKHDLNADKNVFSQVYNIFYANDTYKSLWFTPNNPANPMIIAPDNVISSFHHSSNAQEKRYAELFDFRVTQWPNEETLHENGAPWIDFTYPQTSQQGWISLSTAQHVTVNMSDTVNSRGRGWHPTRYNAHRGYWTGENNHDDWRKNLNFQAQWDTVLGMTPEQKAKDAKYVFLTGWNEWVAEKLRAGNGKYFTCDTYSPEYSRDIEPTRSAGLKDYAYFLTIMNIHNDNFKPAVHYQYPEITPDISKDDTTAWDSSTAVYQDFVGECADRNFKNMAGDKIYVDKSGRNDIDTITLLHDKEYLYFRVTCAEDITAYRDGDHGWMNIWLKTSNARGDLFHGYEYIINREVSGETSQILRCKSASDMESVGEADVRVYGKTMIVRIPLAAIGLDANHYGVEWKVSDNVQDIENDILNFYSTGDAAPIGTINFSYGY